MEPHKLTQQNMLSLQELIGLANYKDWLNSSGDKIDWIPQGNPSVIGLCKEDRKIVLQENPRVILYLFYYGSYREEPFSSFIGNCGCGPRFYFKTREEAEADCLRMYRDFHFKRIMGEDFYNEVKGV